MFEMIKMFLGFLFSLGLTGYVIYAKLDGWMLASIVFGLSTIIFLGQFIVLIGG